MSKEYSVDGLALEIREHWKKHRPTMCRQLKVEGKLDQALYEASERTGDAFADLVGGWAFRLRHAVLRLMLCPL